MPEMQLNVSPSQEPSSKIDIFHNTFLIDIHTPFKINMQYIEKMYNFNKTNYSLINKN